MKRIRKHVLVIFITAVLVMAFNVPATFGSGTTYEIGNEQGHFVVEDAFWQFNALKDHGEALGWELPEANGAPDPSMLDHYQGIARYPDSGTPIFYVTQRKRSTGGYLHVVRMGSRDTDGERLRSNLQAYGIDTAETSPLSSDTWIHDIHFRGSLPVLNPSLHYIPAYEHPGGMAIVDDILFMSLDTPKDDTFPNGQPIPDGQILLFDLSPNPEDPQLIQNIPLSHSIDNIAVTRMDDGTYLLFTVGGGGEDVFFYRTTSTDLREQNIGATTMVQDWNYSSSTDYDGNGNPWPGDGIGDAQNSHQSSTFLREPDGTLYLIGMRHIGVGNEGWDYADLYRVDVNASETHFKIIRERTRSFHCNFDLGGAFDTSRICNFAAGNNAYVSPSGELILYSLPHDDQDYANPDFVRMAEFRHQEVNRPNSSLRLPTVNFNHSTVVAEGGSANISDSTITVADRPWVELFDDSNFFGDRSIVVDYDDRGLLELNNFNNLDYFNDKTSAVRWRLPVGLDVELFDDDNYDDRRIILRGTGQTEEIANLGNQVVVPGLVEHPGRNAGESIGFNDKTSSMRFIGTEQPPTASFSWDLDGDGIFGEFQPWNALRGAEIGNTPLFLASNLDGPSVYEVTYRASNGYGTTEDDLYILVVNAAPSTPDIGNDVYVDEGSSIVLQGSGSVDPAGAADPLFYEWDLDYNGAVFNVDERGLTPTFSAANLDGPTTVTIALRARDDDGGFSAADTAVVHVVDVAPAAPDAGEDFTIDEGSTVTLDGIGIIDPIDPVTYEWDFDYDGTTFDIDAVGLDADFTAIDGPATVTIALRAVDDDGGISLVDTATVQVNNVIPVPDAGQDRAVPEGVAVTLNGTAQDPAGAADALTFEWDFDYDGVTFDVDAVGAVPTFVGADGPSSFTVALRVWDDATDENSVLLDTAQIDVVNSAPVLQAFEVSSGYSLDGIALTSTPVYLDGSFVDVSGDVHTAVVDWGDGTIEAVSVDDLNDLIFGRHTYANSGDYQVYVTVTDEDGASTAAFKTPYIVTVFERFGALDHVVSEIDMMLSMAEPEDQVILTSAKAWLVGDKYGNRGAIDELQAGNDVIALEKIGNAVDLLTQKGPQFQDQYPILRQLLALVAQGTAQMAFDDLLLAVGPKPTTQQQQQIDQIDVYMTTGVMAIERGDSYAAVQDFHAATSLAIATMP